MNKIILATLLIGTTLVAACSKKEEAAAPQQKTETVASSAVAAVGAVQKAADAQNVAPAAASTVSGTIGETMNASGYTYLKIKTATGEEWAAVPESVVKKGTPVTVEVQMVAEKFESKSLNRKFDRIIFGTLAGAKPATAAAPMASQMPPGHPTVPGAAMPGNPIGSAVEHMKGGAADIGPVEVAKAEGANAKTVAELWAARTALKDKPVAVRGKVVKFLPGIMGRNWVHLRDGSGSADKGDHDITVTTNETANIGDVVLVNGVVRVDRDFGAGYAYPVIIEDGRIVK